MASWTANMMGINAVEAEHGGSTSKVGLGRRKNIRISVLGGQGSEGIHIENLWREVKDWRQHWKLR